MMSFQSFWFRCVSQDYQSGTGEYATSFHLLNEGLRPFRGLTCDFAEVFDGIIVSAASGAYQTAVIRWAAIV